MHVRASAGVVLVAVGGLLAASPTHAQQGQRPNSPSKPHEPEVRRLVFHGVKHVDLKDLQASINTQASSCKSLVLEPFCLASHSPTYWNRFFLDHTELSRDLLRIEVFYWIRGYRNTRVDTTVTKDANGVAVAFNVAEGPPTRLGVLRIEYDSTLISDKQRRSLTYIHAGDPLSLVLLDSMRVSFLQLMWDKGHADATVDTTTDVDTVAKVGNVVMRVIPGWATRVGAVDITGQTGINPTTIMHLLTFHEGDLYRRSDVLKSERNLYESNLFRLATIPPPHGDSIKNVQIHVIEAPEHDVSGGVGFNTVDFFQTRAGYTDYNVFGDARRLDVNGDIGNLMAQSLGGVGFFDRATRTAITPQDAAPFLQPTWDASMDFTQPAFLNQPPNTLGFSVFAHRKSEPGVYVDRAYGASATFTRNIAERAPISLSYRYEITRTEANDVYFCADYGMCDTSTIGALRSHQSLSPMALTTFIDRTDNPFAPTTGYTAHLDLEHASAFTASDYRYNRAYFEATSFLPLMSHGGITSTVLAMHLEVGAVQDLGAADNNPGVLHPSKRFYAGGSQSVRGYGENQLGPRVLTIDPASLRGHNDSLCAASIPITQCNPNVAGLSDAQFTPRPLGGTSLIEGTVELRFPLISDLKIDGAVFVDGAVVGENQNALGQVTTLLQGPSALRSLASGTGAITPGFGGRYMSPVGMIRVDIGVSPVQTQSLTVITSDVVNGQEKIVPLTTTRRYTQGGGSILSRLVLHLSIGQAF